MLNLLSQNIENSLQKAAGIMETTSKTPEVRGLSFVHQINNAINGISNDSHQEKRKLAQNILTTHEDFVPMIFLMPNGDVYMIEPHSRQQNLSTANLSFRDYYKGAIDIKNVFLGDVITAASSGRNQAVIAMPMFLKTSNDNNGSSLLGIWAAGLNFDVYNKMLQSLIWPGAIAL